MKREEEGDLLRDQVGLGVRDNAHLGVRDGIGLADHDQVELDVRVKYGFAHESSQAKIPVDSTARILAADQYERRAKNQAAGEEVQKRWVYLQ